MLLRQIPDQRQIRRVPGFSSNPGYRFSANKLNSLDFERPFIGLETGVETPVEAPAAPVWKRWLRRFVPSAGEKFP